MIEEWLPVVGYEGLYEVSNKGRVRSVARVVTWKNQSVKTYKSRIMKFRVKGGYCYISLYKDFKPKEYRLHRLVAEAFIPNPNNLPVVNHIDENKLNNEVENLEWCTRQYNNSYGTRGKRISETKKRKYRLKQLLINT